MQTEQNLEKLQLHYMFPRKYRKQWHKHTPPRDRVSPTSGDSLKKGILIPKEKTPLIGMHVRISLYVLVPWIMGPESGLGPGKACLYKFISSLYPHLYPYQPSFSLSRIDGSLIREIGVKFGCFYFFLYFLLNVNVFPPLPTLFQSWVLLFKINHIVAKKRHLFHFSVESS